MLQNIRHVVFDPDRFFSERAGEPTLSTPIALVFGLIVVNTLNTALMLSYVEFDQQPMAESMAAIANVFGMIVGIIGVFVLWLVYTAVLYAGSAVFGGSGSFRRLFMLVGWGYVPQLVGGVISLALSWYALQSVPTNLTAETFLQQYRSHAALQAATAVNLLMVIWQGFIWTFAVRYSRDIALKHAAVVAFVPVLGNLAWNVWNLL